MEERPKRRRPSPDSNAPPTTGNTKPRGPSARSLQRNIREESLRESQAKFQDLVETIGDWVWEVDREGIFTYASPRVRDLLGYEPEEVLGRTPFDLMPLAEAQRVGRLFRSLAASRLPIVALVNINVHKNGRLVVLETSGAPIFDAGGAFRGYRGVDRDITARKEAEAALEESEERFRSIFELSADPICIADIHGCFRLVNPAFERVLGYVTKELLSKPFLEFVHPEDRGKTLRVIEEKLQRGETVLSFENRYVRKDGVVVWLEWMSRPFAEDLTIAIARDITGRKHADQIVSRLAAIVESSDDAITGKTLEGIITNWNKGAEILYGYAAEEALGRNISFLVPPDREDDVSYILEKIRNEQSIDHYETVRIGKDGRRIDVSVTISPVKDAAGKILGASTIARDITERKRMEEALRRSHEELEERVRERTRELVDLTEDLRAEVMQRREAEAAARREQAFRETVEDSLVVGLVAMDTEGKILSVNEAFCTMTGWSKEELIGTAPPHGFWAPEENKTIYAAAREPLGICCGMDGLAAAREAMGEGSPLDGREFVLRRRGGERFPVLVYASPLRDPDGTLKGYVGSVTDITERKEAEAEYRTILATAMDGFWISDHEGRFIDVNDAACRHLGYSREELLGGMRIKDIEAAESPEDVAPHIRKIREVGHNRFETLHRRRDGTLVDTEVSVNYLDIGGGRFFVFIRDITERKKAERIALTQQKMDSLGQVAAGIAHEIRNPLSGLNLFIHSLEKLLSEAEALDLETRQSAEAIIAMMQGASTKMEGTIKRVLAFSRPVPARKEPFDVNACVLEALDMARVSLQKAGVRVTVTLMEDLPPCLGDMHLLAQALINLLTNAAQAMEGQEQEKRIEIVSDVRDGHVTVLVADSGPGVPPHLRERLFEPFFTTKKEGTGIGLSLSHKIVSDKGGFLRVGDSRFGGALFTIGLPAGDRETNGIAP
jgi:PAS domain S-box-containing protein